MDEEPMPPWAVRIETKLDFFISRQDDHENRIRILESHATADHGNRLTSLEQWKFTLPVSGLVALISAIAAVIAALGK